MTTLGLQAIRAVGGVVPPSLLARIQAAEVSDPASLSPASYHLAGRETIRDAASRAWSYLRGAWAAWREHVAAQPPGSAGTGAARERWLLVLLRELGYGHVPAVPGGYVIERPRVPHLARLAACPGTPARARRGPRPPQPRGGRRGPRAAGHGAGTSQPGRQPPVGDPLQRRQAEAAARLHRSGRVGLPGVRPGSHLRRRAVPGVPADVAALPRLPGRETQRARSLPGRLLAGILAQRGRGRWRAGAGPAARRRGGSA